MSPTQQEISGWHWLAEACELETGTLPVPSVVVQQMKTTGFARELKRYLAWWLTHPDPGSNFDKSTRLFRWLPARLVLGILVSLGYDGLIYWRDGRIIGHLFFQRHGDALCAFSLAVADEVRGQGWSNLLVLDFVAYAAQAPGIRRASVGSGRNRVTTRVLQLLRGHVDRLPLSIAADGWIHFTHADSQPSS